MKHKNEIMKKLRGRLIRKITDIISAYILWCDGSGSFKVSSQYRFPISDKFIIDVTKNIGLSYHVLLKEYGDTIIDTTLDYDIYQKDVPFQKAYTTKGIRIKGGVDNIPRLKELLGDMRNEKR